MQEATIDLVALARALADRNPTRTEATVQAQLHAFLLAAPLQLEDHHLQEIVLEQPAGQRRRIDVELGRCVFEVKRDLRKGRVLDDAEVQLAGYVHQRSEQTGQRYVGVLTDGCEWRLYRATHSELVHVSTLDMNAEQPNVEGLCVWLEGVLATGEQLAPTPFEIERLLGATSPAHLLDIADLTDLFGKNKTAPTVKLKRKLWARLLTTALGTAFRDDEALFVQHTLLVVTAEIIAHAVLDIDPKQIPAVALVSGQQFRAARVLGVVEADFFDWVAEVPGGERVVRDLARRLSRFAWANVEHDVLKTLYESVIPTAQRKQLGEYYTPDWLAEHVVDTTVADPLKMKVLDPSCGSGTFIFYAVRKYLDAAEAVDTSNKDALAGVCSAVMGMDLHPVAVTLARVTYLLAIGPQRLQEERGPISIPVFLGDSLQWKQEDTLETHRALVVPTDEGPGPTSDDEQLFPAQLQFADSIVLDAKRLLRFPDSLVADAGRFDGLVADIAEKARTREPGSPPPSLAQLHRRYGIPAADQPMIDQTFRLMCDLHDQGRDHIWGYYVRNLARPRWLARDENNVDVLVGNPPWLSYRFMTPTMQKEFAKLLKERQLWAGAKSVTHLDLSGLFVARTVERYLRRDGRFAFVMPFAVLSRQHFAGFRKGVWPRRQGFPVAVAFDTAWDLHAVKPAFFEVPCSVIRGRRTEERNSQPIPQVAEGWTGRLPTTKLTWAEAESRLRIEPVQITAAKTSAPASPYASRFSQGASLVPRVLCLVEKLPAGPLGRAAGETRVRSFRAAAEKAPWKSLPSLEGSVENNFILPVHVGDTILPYRTLEPRRAIVPWDGQQLLHSGVEQLNQYPGLSDWWTRVEGLWNANRRGRLSLIQQFDYRGKLRGQFGANGQCAPLRVVYTKSGMYLAAAIVEDPSAVIDHKLYWGACGTPNEAAFLCAVLNSDCVTTGVRKYQARGEHNPRDFDMYVWQLAIPEFDANDPEHGRIVELADEVRLAVADLGLPETRFEKQRRFVREWIMSTSAGKEIDARVRVLLGL